MIFFNLQVFFYDKLYKVKEGFTFTIYLFAVYVLKSYSTLVEVRRQVSEACPLLPSCGSQGLKAQTLMMRLGSSTLYLLRHLFSPLPFEVGFRIPNPGLSSLCIWMWPCILSKVIFKVCDFVFTPFHPIIYVTSLLSLSLSL